MTLRISNRALLDVDGNTLLDYGDTVPENGRDGYARGALFICTADATVWRNGALTSTSALFSQIHPTREAYGTAEVEDGGATYVTVIHGLLSTPSAGQIQVSPTNDMGAATKFWISDITSATFRINVDQDPDTKSATFCWYGRV